MFNDVLFISNHFGKGFFDALKNFDNVTPDLSSYSKIPTSINTLEEKISFNTDEPNLKMKLCRRYEMSVSGEEKPVKELNYLEVEAGDKKYWFVNRTAFNSEQLCCIDMTGITDDIPEQAVEKGKLIAHVAKQLQVGNRVVYWGEGGVKACEMINGGAIPTIKDGVVLYRNAAINPDVIEAIPTTENPFVKMVAVVKEKEVDPRLAPGRTM